VEEIRKALVILVVVIIFIWRQSIKTIPQHLSKNTSHRVQHVSLIARTFVAVQSKKDAKLTFINRADKEHYQMFDKRTFFAR
jgi:hypothetical protein